ncbi:MAG: 5-(carboxyamino)imidazole ribonucleotide mutase [Candidatus Omnitrophica bacterium]|nr:5-(carboxyamino)imidazole ribonucleotide mutase [Candidatus Omnitrophota bacterium]
MKAKVAIIVGSDSDLKVINEAEAVLRMFKVSYDLKVLSAHRTPRDTALYAQKARAAGIKVIIAGAGGAAHLAGLIAAHTALPVIGVPMETPYLKGIDSLFSTVQMPGGVPVGCMAIGAAGAKNAALFALEILAVSDEAIYKKLAEYKNKLARFSKREK